MRPTVARRISCLVAILAPAGPLASHAAAQEGAPPAGVVTGRVSDSETRAPLLTASVEILDAAGDRLALRLTDAAGRFAAPVQGVPARIQVRRLGYGPLDLELDGVPTTPMELGLEPMPFQLEALVAEAERQCGDRGSGAALARIWEDLARTLEGASRAGGESLAFEVQELVRTYEADGRTETDRAFRLARRVAPRPFVGLQPGGEDGRFIREEGDSMVFYGPDERFLTSAAFQRDHCLEVVDDPEGARVGLRFRPRDEGELAGTFWIRWPELELESLDLRYLHAQWEGVGAEATGEVDFARLPTGAIVVSSWTLTLPVVEVYTVGGPLPEQRSRAVEVREVGGRLLTARTPGTGGDLLFEAGLGSLVGTVLDSLGRPAGAGVQVRVGGSNVVTSTDGEGAFTLPPLPPDSYTVAAFHPGSGSAPPALTRVAVTESRTAEVRLRLPGAWELLVDGCDPADGMPLVLRLRGPDGELLAGRPVRLGTERRRDFVEGGVSDADAVAVLCGLPPGDELVVEVPGYRPVPVAVPAAPEAPVDLELQRVALPDVDAAGSGVEGEVTGAPDGMPVAEAAVWIGDRATTTDARGRFSVRGLEPGRYPIRVEHLGYAGVEDSVQVPFRAIQNVAVELDGRALSIAGFDVTVTSAPRFSRLRDLQRRMETASGEFLTRDDFEARGGSLDQYLYDVPGARVERDRSVTFRGGGAAGGRCSPAVYVDGVPWTHPSRAGSTPLPLDGFSASELLAVEVYPGAARVPGELAGPGTSCGVIAVWTRRGGG